MSETAEKRSQVPTLIDDCNQDRKVQGEGDEDICYCKVCGQHSTDSVLCVRVSVIFILHSADSVLCVTVSVIDNIYYTLILIHNIC